MKIMNNTNYMKPHYLKIVRRLKSLLLMLTVFMLNKLPPFIWRQYFQLVRKLFHVSKKVFLVRFGDGVIAVGSPAKAIKIWDKSKGCWVSVSSDT